MSIIIGISGGSGSGKTTFIKNLEARFQNEEVSFISFDNYYKPREQQQSDGKGIKNFDLPESMDIEAFLSDLNELINGNEISRIEYTFNNAESIPEKITIKPGKVIIVEGLFIYHYPALKEKFDLKLFVSANDEIKIIRRIKRDKVERNYPLEDVLYRYENHVIPSYKRYIEPYKSEMDLIINNNQNFQRAEEVIQLYIQSKLK